jgi:hypothetical protein
MIKKIKSLTWKDFKGKPEINSPFDACLKWGIYYNYKYEIGPNEEPNVNLNVECKIGTDSWFKNGKETEELLNHEYGHFLIAFIYSERFKSKVKDAKFSLKEVDANIQKVFDDTFKDCVNYQNLYDKETNHSLNKEIQKKWNDKLFGEVSNHGFELI